MAFIDSMATFAVWALNAGAKLKLNVIIMDYLRRSARISKQDRITMMRCQKN